MASWYLTPLHLPGLSSSPIRHLHSHLATAADSSRAFYVWLGTDHEWQLFVHSRDSWSLQWTVNLPAAQQLNSASCLSGAGSRSLFYGRGSLIQGWTLKAGSHQNRFPARIISSFALYQGQTVFYDGYAAGGRGRGETAVVAIERPVGAQRAAHVDWLRGRRTGIVVLRESL